jgi:flagellar hook-associated protein 2
MATITSLGIGSGLDLNKMVTQLVAIERQPLTQMQAQASKLQTQVSSFGQISSLLSTLQAASNKLTDATLWSQSAATSSDTGTVSVSGGSGAAAGDYSVVVRGLAASQTLVTGTAYGASTDLIGSGTLTLHLGTWNATQSSFTAKTGSEDMPITVTNTDTVQTLREKINAANMGVNASIITDASGVRLSLRSTATGAENGFSVTALGTAGLAALAFDPPHGANGMVLKESAANAHATVNGIAVESASNTLTGVVEGLTLTLNKENATAVTVSARPDRASVTTAIKSFADAYNALASYIGTQTAYDATAKIGGVLQGDSATNTLQSQLRSVLGSTSGASSTFAHLSDLGLEVQRDGTLSIDQTKLDSAANNLTELKKAFANSDSTNPAKNGFARRYATLAMQVLGVGGTVTSHAAGLQTLISKNADDQTRLNDRVNSFQARLVSQYTAMDANLAKLNALSSYVTQQVAIWTKSSSTN